MTPGRHAVVSGLLAAGCGFAWHSPAAAGAAFLGGTAIDADHLLDYAWNGLGPFRLGRFLRACDEYRLKRFYLPAHSLEWILPALAWCAAADGPPWLKAAALGLGAHMAMDLLGNGMIWPAYFLSFRAWHRFDPRRFVYALPASGLAYWGSHAAWRRGILADPAP